MTYISAEETPLFKKTYQLLKQVEKICNGMKKDRKHTIGQFMINNTLSMIRCVRVANDLPNMREQALIEYLGCHVELSSLLKMSEEEKWIDSKSYTSSMVLMDSVKRQSQGWLNSCTKGQS